MNQVPDVRQQTGLRHLLLVGAGPAHMWVLKQLGESRPADLKISLVAPALPAIHPRLLAGWVSGRHPLQDCLLPLEALARVSQARLYASPCQALDAARRVLQLTDGQTLPFDLLSLDTEAHMGRARAEIQMPGARQHALFLHPMALFVSLWPKLLALAAERAIHVVVVGGEAAGLELALAVAGTLCKPHGSRLSWVSETDLASLFPAASMRRRIEARLRELRITMLQAACVGISDSEVSLSNGARLLCDAPILAGPRGVPDWLASSDLALDAWGRVLVDGQARSRSQPHVFAVNHAASSDGRGAGYPDRAGPKLLRALRASFDGKGRRVAAGERPGRADEVQILTCGEREALASWRGIGVGGWVVGSVKQALDRRFMRSLGGA